MNPLEQAGDLIRQGRLDQARQLCLQLQARSPGHPAVAHLLGTIAFQQNQLPDALTHYEQAVSAWPDHPDFLNSLGLLLLRLDRVDEAVVHFERALKLHPHHLPSRGNLGNALKRRGDLLAAAACFRQIIEQQPAFAEAHYNLAQILARQGDLGAAIAGFRQALALKPQLSEPHNELANALKEQGLIDPAVDHFRQAWRLGPHNQPAASNLIFAMHYLPHTTAAEVTTVVRSWRESFVDPLHRAQRSFLQSRNPHRLLRVGFVSPSLRQHPHGVLLRPVLAAHNRDQFHMTCYTDTRTGDALTAELRSLADDWVCTAGMSHAAVADRIRADAVDILIDLSRHTAGNRLIVFTHRPAPVQVTWLGGPPSSSGLVEMDYLITDRRHLPQLDASLYTEKIVFLDGDYLCYAPPVDAPPVSPLPMLRNGFVTFACFNALCKINERVIALWAGILADVPGSKLLLRTRALGDESTRAVVRGRFADAGVASARLILEPFAPHAELLATYHRADLVLDPFPYTGGITTCEALWMGVPAVTLNPPGFAVRHSVSHLTSAGLADWIASDEKTYRDLAVGWAHDPAALARLRSTLRERLAASELCDAPAFARRFESALRDMWRTWCDRQP